MSNVCTSTEELCTAIVMAKGLCKRHYNRAWSRARKPATARRWTFGAMCKFEGCVYRAKSKGLCNTHYGCMRNNRPMRPNPKTWNGRCKTCNAAGPFFKNYKRCKECCRLKTYSWSARNPDAAKKMARESAIRQHSKHRTEILAAYGGKCRCCGEVEEVFLAVDHIDGGGNAHRRSLTKSGAICGTYNFYGWLVRHGFPEGFQLLCHNCNFAKSHGGCPHVKKRTVAA